MRVKVLNKFFTLVVLSLTAIFFVSSSYAKEDMDKKQKVQKYRVTQISEQDVTLDDTSINTIMQSDKMQNLLKNEKYQEVMESEDFRAGAFRPLPSIRKAGFVKPIPSVRKAGLVKPLPTIRKGKYGGAIGVVDRGKYGGAVGTVERAGWRFKFAK